MASASRKANLNQLALIQQTAKPDAPDATKAGLYAYDDGTLALQFPDTTEYIFEGSTETLLTTKGDLLTFDTAPTRLGIGANNAVLVADSTAATGNKWSATLAGLTLTTPTIGDFTNATHTHQSNAQGGSLDAAAIGSGTLNNARVNWASPSAIGTGTPAAGTFTTLTATTGTFTDLVTITKTTEQLRVRYDASNYTSFTTGSSGNLTVTTIGTTSGFTSSVSAAAMLFNLRNSAAVNAANTVEVDYTLESSTTTQVASSLTVAFSDTTNATRTSTVTLNVSDSGTFAAGFTLVGRKATLSGSATFASAAGSTWDGITFGAATATITGSTHITTAAGVNYISIARPTLSAASALTVDNAATLYIVNSPLGGGVGPVAITNAYALWVGAGTARFDGNTTFNGGQVTFTNSVNIATGTGAGTKIGTVGGASGQKIGFFNATPIVQPLLATGAAHTVDDVITTLQNLGLCRQS